MNTQDFAADLAAFDRAIANDTGPDAPWIALETLARKVIGARLFTTMTVDMKNEVARRAYTSDPVSYPSSGTKPIRYDSWFDIVHKERRSFVANTIEDIAEVFDDHEIIKSLGCESVINVPIVVNGEVIGGLFFGHSGRGRFLEEHEELLVGIAGQAAIAIDNARLYQAAEREIAERKRAEEALQALNALKRRPLLVRASAA